MAAQGSASSSKCSTEESIRFRTGEATCFERGIRDFFSWSV